MTAATTTLVVCSECGLGNYRTTGRGLWVCTGCGHTVGWHDVLPEAGEHIATVDGLLAVEADEQEQEPEWVTEQCVHDPRCTVERYCDALLVEQGDGGW